MSALTQKLAKVGDHAVHALKHPTKRNFIYFMVILWVNAINMFVFYHRHEALTLLNNTLNEVAPVNNYKGHAIPRKLIESVVFKMWAKEEQIDSNSRRIDTHLSSYDDFFADHDVNSFIELNYGERCDAYFRSMYSKSMSWSVNAADDFLIDMNYRLLWEEYKNKFMGWAVQQVSAEKQIPELEVDKGGLDVHDKLAKVYDSLKDKAKRDEYTMRDYISHVRIFNRCFVDREDGATYHRQLNFILQQHLVLKSLGSKFQPTKAEGRLDKNAFDSCSELHLKIYPWMHSSFPLYQRHTGEIFRAPPHMNKYISDHQVLASTDPGRVAAKGSQKPVRSALTNNKQCWINQFKNKVVGKGIVVPYKDSNSLDNVVNLIHTLRSLGNKYPIQIVHYQQLDETSRALLVDAATRPFSDFPRSYERVEDLLPDLVFDSGVRGFLKQELWFVDAATMVSEHFQSRMSTVPILAWAAVVNSFDEYILMDPLAVPLQNPQHFFDQPEYKAKGAYFYRARPYNTRDERDLKFFNKMGPSLVDLTFFDIPLLSPETLDSVFFDSLGEYQDPRVAVINRGRHFSSVMLLLQLAMFFPANHRDNSAKEIWLAFVLNGDNDFHFNFVLPGAVGKATEQSMRTKPQNKIPDSLEICSTQVGHFDPRSQKLVWIGGGFRGCFAWDMDYVMELSTKVYLWRHIAGEEDLKSFYSSRVTLEQAVVPPFTNVKSLLLENDENEPPLPWLQHVACEDGFFCAYSRIGGKKGEQDTTLRGQVIDFDRKDIELYNFYGDIWIGSD